MTATDLRERFAEDGVVHVPGFLDAEWLDLVRLGVERNMASPGPNARTLYAGTDREMYLDYCNYRGVPEYRILLADSPIVDLVAGVVDSDDLWLFFEQIWIKEGGTARRTPWHQDLTVWLTSPGKLCGCWITLDPLPAERSLEFVRGSHLGPLYDMTRLDGDPGDDTAPLYGGMDRLPDIESDRGSYDIVSFPNEPGDVVLFHPAILHGGGASMTRRRTLSLRFYGDDVTYEPPVGPPSPAFPGVGSTVAPGQPLRSSWFPRVRPRPTLGG
jgi:ectoine hydroxylase-related dioxygenase (phytanoyl-CoA dioxygenase family)